jgi:hypothetical protein
VHFLLSQMHSVFQSCSSCSTFWNTVSTWYRPQRRYHGIHSTEDRSRLIRATVLLVLLSSYDIYLKHIYRTWREQPPDKNALNGNEWLNVLRGLWGMLRTVAKLKTLKRTREEHCRALHYGRSRSIVTMADSRARRRWPVLTGRSGKSGVVVLFVRKSLKKRMRSEHGGGFVDIW